MTKIMAVDPVKTDLGTIEGLGPFGKPNFTGASAMEKLIGAISAIIGFLTLVAVVWFFIQFTLGGISWITAAGDKQKLTQARDKLSNAFVGLVIVVAGWAILGLAGQFFGWEDILLPSSIINKIIFK
jgi:hypothetical protein